MLLPVVPAMPGEAGLGKDMLLFGNKCPCEVYISRAGTVRQEDPSAFVIRIAGLTVPQDMVRCTDTVVPVEDRTTARIVLCR